VVTALLITAILFGCSSVDYTQNRQTVFTSNYDTEGFLMYAPGLLKDDGFTILASDVENGILRANKSEAGKFNLDLIFNIDKNSREVKLTIANRIRLKDNDILEYYSIDEYNHDYEKYFLPVVLSIKSNAVKTAFPTGELCR